MSTSPDTIRTRTVTIATIAFMIACATPALVFKETVGLEGIKTLYGWWCLLTGPFLLASSQPAWLANLGIVAGGIQLLRRKYKSALVWSALAMVLALTTFALFDQEVLSGEGMGKMRLKSLEIGYWLWLLCPTILFAGAEWCRGLRAEAEPEG